MRLHVVGGTCAPAMTSAAAYDRYATLVRRADAEPALRTNLAHSIAIARAWATWRDLFLADDRVSQ